MSLTQVKVASNPHQSRGLSASTKRDVSLNAVISASVSETTLRLERALTLIQHEHPLYFSFAMLQFTTGCRAAEAVFCSKHFYYVRDILCMQPAKRNAERVFSVDEQFSIEKFLFRANCAQFNGCSLSTYRSIIRSAMQRAGIQLRSAAGNLYGATHIFRHAFVKRLMAQGLDLPSIKHRIGEKTDKAMNTYISSTIYIVP